MFGCHHPTPGLRIGSVSRDFFNFGEGQSCSQGLTTLWYKPGRRKMNLDLRLLLQQILTRLWLISGNKGIQFNWWTPNTAPITKLSLSWFIIVRFIHIMYTFYIPEKNKCSGGCSLFCLRCFLISIYDFHRFSCNQVAVNLDPTAVLVWNGNIVEKPLKHRQ